MCYLDIAGRLKRRIRSRAPMRLGAAAVMMLLLTVFTAGAHAAGQVRTITSADCIECHDTPKGAPTRATLLSSSVHDSLTCLDCHQHRGEVPHPDQGGFRVGANPCRGCHTDVAKDYTVHGYLNVGASNDLPVCADCHGSHHVLTPSDPASSANGRNLKTTCGRCHRNVDLIRKYDLAQNLLKIYEGSIHGQQDSQGRTAAVCTDCHATGADAHRLLSPRFSNSTINHLNIPATCGRCHEKVGKEYGESIHGQLAARGGTDVPVCTGCHGEHGIIAVTDPRSPVSPTKVAGDTCAPCHDSVMLNEKYGLGPGKMISFVDSYHGLKSRTGDTTVANCASCHGVHLILPPDDPRSSVNPANLKSTCGQCHPDISAQMAKIPIHGIGGQGLRTRAAQIIGRIYVVAIVVIIGLMMLHWLVDLARRLVEMTRRKPRVRRMLPSEVAQHTLVMLSFITLALTGFALKYETVWFAKLLFGWKGGFELRGTIHRIAAVVFMFDIAWHLWFIAATRRGRGFVSDMLPEINDFVYFWNRLAYNLGLHRKTPAAGRFSYVEKAEYWALVWGSAVMVITGLMLWFDKEVVQVLPQGALDIAWVVHFYEAVLATLAILVWHLYSTVFNPEVYPMNPSWLTGKMPEDMYRREHPEHLDQAISETDTEDLDSPRDTSG
jgi:formate dehydrogenase gamma subunit